MIAQFLTASRCDRVLRLLDEERKVILEGPLASLQTVVDRRERALAGITATSCSRCSRVCWGWSAA